MIMPLTGGLGDAVKAAVAPTDTLLHSIQTGPGEAVVLTTERLMIVRAGMGNEKRGLKVEFPRLRSVTLTEGLMPLFQVYTDAVPQPPADTQGVVVRRAVLPPMKELIADLEALMTGLGLTLERTAPAKPGPPATQVRSRLRGNLGKAVNRSLMADESVLDELHGHMGEGLVVTNRRVMIVKAGHASETMFGQKISAFPFSSVASVEVSAGLINGRIEIRSSGLSSAKTRDSIKGMFKTAQEENVVQITRSHLSDARRLANLIEERRTAPMHVEPVQVEPVVIQAAAPALSVGDELRKLADLRKDGVLTDQEFEMAKAKLLGS